MTDAKKEFQKFKEVINNVKLVLEKLSKYKGNPTYKKKLNVLLSELNRSSIFLKAKIDKSNEQELKNKFKTVSDIVNSITSDGINVKKNLKYITDLEKFWPELEVELENLNLNIKSFEIPKEIPMIEYRFDIEEAVKDFDNGCFISSLVLCRRAYEGALVALYKSKEGKEPIEERICKRCKNSVGESYVGISNLHKWAINNKIITDKLKSVGFLLTDIGAGAAHPPLSEFPRDEGMARLGITATLTLLNEIHKNK